MVCFPTMPRFIRHLRNRDQSHSRAALLNASESGQNTRRHHRVASAVNKLKAAKKTLSGTKSRLGRGQEWLKLDDIGQEQQIHYEESNEGNKGTAIDAPRQPVRAIVKSGKIGGQH